MNHNIPKLKFLPFLLIIIACTSTDDKNASKEKKDSHNYIQKEYDSTIYIGNIKGEDSGTFISKYPALSDSIYGLTQITKSSNQIEIRIYSHDYWSDTSYCTILFYDSMFKMNRIQHYYLYDTVSDKIKNRLPINKNLAVKANADSIFSKLIENGVFSLTQFDKKDYLKQNPKELTKNGLVNGTYIGGIDDGIAFTLEFKVDSIYNVIHINNPYSYFQHNPDYQLFRRYNEITTLLHLGFE